MGIHYKKTKFGFEYGNAKVTRLHHSDKQGWAIIQIESSKYNLQVYVTKTGKIRIHDGRGKGEWKKPPIDI